MRRGGAGSGRRGAHRPRASRVAWSGRSCCVTRAHRMQLAAGLLDPRAGPLHLDSAARYLASAGPRLIVVDDMDRGGPEAAAMLWSWPPGAPRLPAPR